MSRTTKKTPEDISKGWLYGGLTLFLTLLGIIATLVVALMNVRQDNEKNQSDLAIAYMNMTESAKQNLPQEYAWSHIGYSPNLSSPDDISWLKQLGYEDHFLIAQSSFYNSELNRYKSDTSNSLKTRYVFFVFVNTGKGEISKLDFVDIIWDGLSLFSPLDIFKLRDLQLHGSESEVIRKEKDNRGRGMYLPGVTQDNKRFLLLLLIDTVDGNTLGDNDIIGSHFYCAQVKFTDQIDRVKFDNSYDCIGDVPNGLNLISVPTKPMYVPPP